MEDTSQKCGKCGQSCIYKPDGLQQLSCSHCGPHTQQSSAGDDAAGAEAGSSGCVAAAHVPSTRGNDHGEFTTSTEGAQDRATPATEGGNKVSLKKIENQRQYDKGTEQLIVALKMIGLDISLIAELLTNNTRKEWKKLFVKAVSLDPNLIEKVLMDKQPLDLEKLRACAWREDEVVNIGPQIQPGSSGKKGKVCRSTARKQAVKQRNKDAPTSMKRKDVSELSDNSADASMRPPEKKVETGANPTTYRAVPQKVIPRISNIMCKFNLGVKVDLKKIMRSLFISEWDPAFSSRVTLRLGSPKSSADAYCDGKVDCKGTITMESARQATRIFAQLIKDCGHPLVKYLKFEVYNITATFKANFLINLEKLAKNESDHCKYDPEILEAAHWYMDDPKVTFIIFPSGSINLLGGTTMDGVCKAYEELFKIIQKYKK